MAKFLIALNIRMIFLHGKMRASEKVSIPSFALSMEPDSGLQFRKTLLNENYNKQLFYLIALKYMWSSIVSRFFFNFNW